MAIYVATIVLCIQLTERTPRHNADALSANWWKVTDLSDEKTLNEFFIKCVVTAIGHSRCHYSAQIYNENLIQRTINVDLLLFLHIENGKTTISKRNIKATKIRAGRFARYLKTFSVQQTRTNQTGACQPWNIWNIVRRFQHDIMLSRHRRKNVYALNVRFLTRSYFG